MHGPMGCRAGPRTPLCAQEIKSNSLATSMASTPFHGPAHPPPILNRPFQTSRRGAFHHEALPNSRNDDGRALEHCAVGRGALFVAQHGQLSNLQLGMAAFTTSTPFHSPVDPELKTNGVQAGGSTWCDANTRRNTDETQCLSLSQ